MASGGKAKIIFGLTLLVLGCLIIGDGVTSFSDWKLFLSLTGGSCTIRTAMLILFDGLGIELK